MSEAIPVDSYRALAAGIVWRAVQGAFCSNKYRPNTGLCLGRHNCRWCRWEAYEWLLSLEGRQMAEWAGIDGEAMVERVVWLRREGLYLRQYRRGLTWVTRR